MVDVVHLRQSWTEVIGETVVDAVHRETSKIAYRMPIRAHPFHSQVRLTLLHQEYSWSWSLAMALYRQR